MKKKIGNELILLTTCCYY